MVSVPKQVWDHSPEHWQTIRSLNAESISFLFPLQLSIDNNPSPGDMTLWVPLLSMPKCWLTGSCIALMQVITVAMNLWDQWLHYLQKTLFHRSLPQHQVFTINHFTPSPMMVPETFRVGMKQISHLGLSTP